MSIKSRIRTRAWNLLLNERSRSAKRMGAELGRRMSGKSHKISVFLQLDDPYSYLLGTYLPSVVESYDIVLKVYLSQALGEPYAPMPALLAEYAIVDCRMLARELGLPFLDKGDTPVIEHRRALLDLLAGEHESDEFPALLAEAMSAYWRGDTEGVGRLVIVSIPLPQERIVARSGQGCDPNIINDSRPSALRTIALDSANPRRSKCFRPLPGDPRIFLYNARNGPLDLGRSRGFK